MSFKNQHLLQMLIDADIPSPEADWRWLSQAITDHAQLETAVIRRAHGVPLQHILGDTAFRYGTLHVREGVFIPRPETEWLVELAKPLVPQGAIVLEIGTGTGAISHALLNELNPLGVGESDSSGSSAGKQAKPSDSCVLAAAQQGQSAALSSPDPGAHIAQLWASDINPKAVELACEHLSNHPEARVVAGSLFSSFPVELQGKVDMVITNPPYLSAADWEILDNEVKDYDPYEALVGGVNGDELIAVICEEVSAWLKPGGYLFVEDDPARVHGNLMRCADWMQSGSVHQDLTGRDRFFSAQKR